MLVKTASAFMTGKADLSIFLIRPSSTFRIINYFIPDIPYDRPLL